MKLCTWCLDGEATEYFLGQDNIGLLPNYLMKVYHVISMPLAGSDKVKYTYVISGKNKQVHVSGVTFHI